ncbi:MAG: hypothetical protein PHX18_00205 [Candidatus Gastranaerophilales bacterium]|nr:hypothetical protein [Candidatus Gastranaerophilales bacterium]
MKLKNLLIIIVIIALGVFLIVAKSSNKDTVINFEHDDITEEDLLLYNYLLEQEGHLYIDGEGNIFNAALQDTKAVVFDLNGDSVPELLGYNTSTVYCGGGAQGCALYILQLKDGKWVNINNGGFFPQMGLVALHKKENGYKKIIVPRLLGKNGLLVFNGKIYDFVK